jgi:hypothetical protein
MNGLRAYTDASVLTAITILKFNFSFYSGIVIQIQVVNITDMTIIIYSSTIMKV